SSSWGRMRQAAQELLAGILDVTQAFPVGIPNAPTGSEWEPPPSIPSIGLRFAVGCNPSAQSISSLPELAAADNRGGRL
ncbi:hypothetical protein, partial [Petrachloros mirabilis]